VTRCSLEEVGAVGIEPRLRRLEALRAPIYRQRVESWGQADYGRSDDMVNYHDGRRLTPREYAAHVAAHPDIHFAEVRWLPPVADLWAHVIERQGHDDEH
jgi:hypothetical protein